MVLEGHKSLLSMQDHFVEVPTATGRMETFVTHPQQNGPFPPVILYMDIWGVREELFDLARRVGTVGYYVMVPDFYYRQGRIRTDFRDSHGKAISLDRLDKEAQQRALAPQTKLSDAMVMEDTGAILNFLSQDKNADARSVGAIGYCMGGRHALQAAARYPERFKASASLHGTSLISERSDSPHLFVIKLQGEVYCGFAEYDAYAPLSMVDELARLMKQSSVRYRYEIHRNARHGYALPDRDIHEKYAAERDWELIFAMLHRQIPPYAAVAAH